MITGEACAIAQQATTKPGPRAAETNRMRRRSIAEVLTGAVVLLVAAGFLAFAVANSGRTAIYGYPLYAQFEHIDGLGVGADVRLAGVKVGSVTEERIDPKSFLAVVGLSVRSDVKLPKDSAAV